MVVIGIYAPRDDTDAKIKVEFYVRLSDEVTYMNRSKEICILGDFRVGKQIKIQYCGKL